MIPTSKLANQKYTSSNLFVGETDKSKLLAARPIPIVLGNF